MEETQERNGILCAEIGARDTHKDRFDRFNGCLETEKLRRELAEKNAEIRSLRKKIFTNHQMSDELNVLRQKLLNQQADPDRVQCREGLNRLDQKVSVHFLEALVDRTTALKPP